ncbi:hypothetical protein [Candidatus Bandiella euplotis]|uniref:Uncharacterized protein n=1 Tax=Candidatus Bandiella euplotis TaxID=1664265 RepID=A0ABZ0UMR3_9RICK|nr:hypothetical protein [Candidatus Bandiella woodruffii]WPX96224.1 hypothetical protein Bandiella_00333 [Candidatus Bandiella woodruffii]
MFTQNIVRSQGIKKEQRNIGNWIAYIEQKSNKKICYAYSNPVKTRLYQGEREKPYININYLGNHEFTIMIYCGYKIASDYPVIITIDNKKNQLNAGYNNGYSITYDSTQDAYITDLLIRTLDNYFIVKSHEDKDNIAIDYYSLSGFKEVLKYLENNCS